MSFNDSDEEAKVPEILPEHKLRYTDMPHS